MERKSKSPKIFNERLKRYEMQFAAAYRFIKALDEKKGNEGMRLSPAANTHLYKGNLFIAHIGLSEPSIAFPTLILSPNANGIAPEMLNCSNELFPREITRVLERHPEGNGVWWSYPTGNAFELRSDTPDIVFDELLFAIHNLPSIRTSNLPTQSP